LLCASGLLCSVLLSLLLPRLLAARARNLKREKLLNLLERANGQKSLENKLAGREMLD
jgi:hypothetical protein